MFISFFNFKSSHQNNQKNSISINKKLFHNYLTLTWLIFFLALLTILIGPYVRAEDAGLACPDWPLCHGYVIPPLDYQIYLEFIHRVIAGVLGLFYIIWFFWGISDKNLRKLLLPYFILSGFVLIMQIYLGRETITKQLNAYIVKFHLLNAVFFVSTIYYVLYRLRKIKNPINLNMSNINKESIEGLYISVLIFLVLLYIQIFLGGRVSANYVGLVCQEFPQCYTEIIKYDNKELINPVYIPPLIYGFEMHFTHRVMGFFLLFYSLFLWYLFSKNNILKGNILFLVSLLLFQVFLGIMNIIFELPTLIRVLHSFSATILFLTTFHLFLELKHIKL
jgi:cytochrome c oxidase assembly protein subunit 15